jgi:hypothetical protein
MIITVRERESALILEKPRRDESPGEQRYKFQIFLQHIIISSLSPKTHSVCDERII